MARLMRFTGPAVLAFGLVGAGVANAQNLPTVEEVAASLYEACDTRLNGELLDIEECIAEIYAAVAVAEGYEALQLPPPQIDIGYILCQLGREFPFLLPEIQAAIEAAVNPYLQVGCQQALAPTEIPPRWVISPA